MSTESFVQARSLDECLARLAEIAVSGRRATLLAGGTDSMVEKHFAARAPLEPVPVIDVCTVPELRSIERSVGADGSVVFRIGAGVTYWQMRQDSALARDVPMLSAMSRDVGAVQIQTRGTLGGNLATGSPAADGVPALAALGSAIELCSLARGARTVSIDEFYTGYRKTVMATDEMITSVQFIAPGPVWYWRKVGTRMAQSIAKVALAATARLENDRITCARFGMASVAPTTALLLRVRGAMEGHDVGELDADALHAALDADIAPIDDVRSTREYRLHTAHRLLDRFVDLLRSHRAP